MYGLKSGERGLAVLSGSYEVDCIFCKETL